MFINFPKLEGLVMEDMDTVKLPNMLTVSQKFDDTKIDDIKAAVEASMEAQVKSKALFSGKTIAVTAGSRGIPSLDIIIKTICDVLKTWGAEPFIVAAMGSHGGGSVVGQLEVLEGYGITEERMGVPVKSTLEVVQYDTVDGIPVYCNKYAWEADGIVLFNKVKPHTDFHGKHESGIVKMVGIGLGDHKGASAIHGAGINAFPELLPKVAEAFIAKRDLIIGAGVVQNAYDDICEVAFADKENIMELDHTLLEHARAKMGCFKFNDCDILIMDEMGKNISGAGQDPNISGRPTPKYPIGFENAFKAEMIVVLGLSAESHHNGCGIGLADVTTRRVLNDIDWGPTWTNHMNSLELHCSKIPCYANCDRDALMMAIRGLDANRRGELKIVRIHNTLETFKIQVSEALYDSIKDIPDIKMLEAAKPMEFDSEGNMTEF